MDQQQTTPRRRRSPYRIATTTVLFLVFLFLLYTVRDQGKACTSNNDCHYGQKCGSVADDAGIVGPNNLDEKTCQSVVRKWVVL